MLFCLIICAWVCKLLQSLQWCSSVGCKSKFPQWHSSVGQFQLKFSSGVLVYPASIRWVTQWYSNVHWAIQWHSSVNWTCQCQSNGSVKLKQVVGIQYAVYIHMFVRLLSVMEINTVYSLCKNIWRFNSSNENCQCRYNGHFVGKYVLIEYSSRK